LAEGTKREQILAAAQALILRQGLRATTMEAIAAEAQVAKPTLYKYFGDKREVFEEIVTSLAMRLHADFSDVLDGKGSIVERLAEALAVKYREIDRVLAGSPHADELYSEQERSMAPQLRRADAATADRVAEELTAAGVKEAGKLTALLLAAAFGVGRKAASPAEIGPAMRLLVERLVGPEVN
jgi:AcrR family transcriptional regulator